MFLKKALPVLSVAIVFTLTSPTVCAEEGETVVKTVDGLHFRLPGDLPVEKRDGVLKPVPYERYLHDKIEAIHLRLTETEEKVYYLEKRLEQVEQEQGKETP